MQKLLLICLSLLAIEYSFSQDAKPFPRNVTDIKGAVVKQEQGEYRNQAGQIEGSYQIVYIIDTLQKQLLNVSVTSKDRRGEIIYLYYYEQNRITKASSGVVQNGYTEIQNTYSYEEEDFAIKEKGIRMPLAKLRRNTLCLKNPVNI